MEKNLKEWGRKNKMETRNICRIFSDELLCRLLIESGKWNLFFPDTGIFIQLIF